MRKKRTCLRLFFSHRPSQLIELGKYVKEAYTLQVFGQNPQVLAMKACPLCQLDGKDIANQGKHSTLPHATGCKHMASSPPIATFTFIIHRSVKGEVVLKCMESVFLLGK